MGVNVSTLYSHIESKQEILKIVALGVADTFTNKTQDVNLKQENAILKIEQIINLYINIALENPERMDMLEKNWIYLENESLEYYKQLRLNFEHNLKTILQEGIATGLLKDINLEIMLNFLLHTLRSINKWYPYKKNITKKTLKNDLSLLIKEAIVKQ